MIIDYSKLRRAYAKLLPVPILGRALRLVVRMFKGTGFGKEQARINEIMSTYSAAISGISDRQDSMVQEISEMRSALYLGLSGLRQASAFNADRYSKLVDDFVNNKERDIETQNNLRHRLKSVEEQGEHVNQGLIEFKEEAASLRKEISEANERFNSELSACLKRIEFIRNETMFELRYRTSGSTRNAPTRIESRIVNEDKLTEQLKRNQVRLNVGAGHKAIEDYLNVDYRELPGIDILADASSIPLEKHSVVEIFSAHLLEHFPEEELKRAILPHFYSLLVQGGEFRAVVPDAVSMLKACAAGEIDFEDYREVTFGLQDYSGDFHYNIFSFDTLKKHLEDAGFSGVELVEEGRRNGKCLEMEIKAKRD